MSGGSDRTSAPDGFDLHSVLGRGASGAVWEATQRSTGRRVALKVLAVDLENDDDHRRFDRERQAMAALANHPHIVTLFDAGVHDDRAWLALQLYRRGSYADRLRRHGPLPVDEAVHVLAAVADALAAAHALRVLHCDVKPANIMVGDYGAPALGDFGVARMAVGGTRTAAGGYSLDHVAPELLDEDRPTPACDVYSLGTTIWTLLSGHPPFRQADDVSTARIIRRILDDPLPPVAAADVPAALQALLSRMAAKDPAARPTVLEVRQATAALAPAVLPRPDDPRDTSASSPAADDDGTGEPSTAGGPDDGPDLTATRLRSRPLVAAPDDGQHEAAPVGPRPGAAAGSGPIRRRRTVVAAAVAAAVVVALAGGIALFLGQREEPLHLVGVDAIDGRPFAPDFTSGTDRMPGLALASSRPDGVAPGSSVPGFTENLYRGERGVASCDTVGLARYLADRPDLAAAWSGALAVDTASGITATPGPTGYLALLTPVLLRSDTLVTLHTADPAGAAEAVPAVLQAGTVVLVDRLGVPRVRCRDGSPLTAPQPGAAPDRTTGEAWPGFDPDAVLTVHAGITPIRQFGLVGLDGDAVFRRPATSTGAADFEPTTATASLEGAYRLVGRQTECNLSDCESSQDREFDLVVFGCSPDRCRATATDSRWEGTLDLVRRGDVWEMSGPSEYGHACEGESKTSTFSLRITADGGEIRDTVWTATSLTGEATMSSPAENECGEGIQRWTVSRSAG